MSKPAVPAPDDISSTPGTDRVMVTVGDELGDLLLAVIDAGGAIREMNRACERATGWRLDEVRGQPIWERLLAPDDARYARQRLTSKRGPEGERTGEWVHRDGHRFAVAWSIAPLPGDDKTAVVAAFDLTAHRLAERRRREGEAIVQALAQSTGRTIFIHRDAQLLYINPAGEATSGYTMAELQAMDFWSIVHPSMREAARAQSAARLRGERVPAHNEVQIITKSGETRWMELTAATIRYRGKLAVVGTAFDVTERRRAEEERRARDHRFRALIERSSDLVVIADADNIITYAGPSIRRVLGYSPSDLEGRRGSDFVHEEDRAVVAGAIQEALARPGQPVTIQYRLRHADGSWRWMEGVGTNLLHEPTVAGFIVNVRDITERRRAESLLRESEQRFALVVDGAKDGVWDWDLRANTLYTSPRMREILEIEKADTQSVAAALAERVRPDEYEPVRERWRAHLRGTDPYFEVEYRVRAGDGTYRWVLARSASVRDGNGALCRMVGSLSDITARKRAEEEARQRQAELAHVQRVSAMGEMAAGLAHELNQPLAAIVNYARGCARRLADAGAAPDLLEALDRIAVEALRAGEVVHSLRRVVRKEPPRGSEMDLNEVVRGAMALVRPEADGREVVLRLELEPHLPHLRADRIQIEQVILNLLRNALEAISKQPGAVSLRTELVDGCAARVTISDTGDGIPAQLRERMFTPFFTTKAGGLGMGLSISRTIVEAHGGRLEAEVNPGTGMTFSFTVPLDDRGAPCEGAGNSTRGDGSAE